MANLKIKQLFDELTKQKVYPLTTTKAVKDTSTSKSLFDILGSTAMISEEEQTVDPTTLVDADVLGSKYTSDLLDTMFAKVDTVANYPIAFTSGSFSDVLAKITTDNNHRKVVRFSVSSSVTDIPSDSGWYNCIYIPSTGTETLILASCTWSPYRMFYRKVASTGTTVFSVTPWKKILDNSDDAIAHYTTPSITGGMFNRYVCIRQFDVVTLSCAITSLSTKVTFKVPQPYVNTKDIVIYDIDGAHFKFDVIKADGEISFDSENGHSYIIDTSYVGKE